jgi:hypothetical protein
VKRRGKGTVAGEILLRRRLDSDEKVVGPAGVDLSALAHLPLAELTSTRSFRAIRRCLARSGRAAVLLAGRCITSQTIRPRCRLSPTRTRSSYCRKRSVPGDFRHSVVGLRRGVQLRGEHRLTEFRLGSTLMLQADAGRRRPAGHQHQR